MNNVYKDIINLPYPNRETERDFPDEVNRAAQFAPFAALAGYGDAVEEAARLTHRRIEPDEDVREELDRKIQYLRDIKKDDVKVTVTYFKPDSRKDGGEYVTHTGTVRKIREYERDMLFDDETQISIDDILSLEFEGYEKACHPE